MPPLVSSDEPYARVVRALAQAQKSNRNAPAYSRWVNRPVGRLLAAAAYKAGLTPNAVTGISAVFTFAGIALVAFVEPAWWLGVVVCLLLALGYALDSADGQLARLRGGGRPVGEWLDHMFDAAKVVSIHLALTILWIRWWVDGAHAVPWPPMLFAAQASVWFFGIILTDVLLRSAGAKAAPGVGVQGERANPLMSLLGIPADYGLIIVMMLLLGASSVFQVVYSVVAVVNVLLLVIQCGRWYRRMAVLG